MRRMLEVKEYEDGSVSINGGQFRIYRDGHIESKPQLETQFIIGGDVKEGSVVENKIVVKDGVVYFHLHAVKADSVTTAYCTDLFQFPVGTRPEKNHGFVLVKQNAIGAIAGFARDNDGNVNTYGWTASTEQEFDINGSFLLPSSTTLLLASQLNGR